jgi:hypothetical protein
MTDAQYIEAAREHHAMSEGDVEVDDNAVVSRGSDHGAYVAAWVWVEDPAEGDAGSEDDPDQESEEVVARGGQIWDGKFAGGGTFERGE